MLLHKDKSHGLFIVRITHHFHCPPKTFPCIIITCIHKTAHISLQNINFENRKCFLAKIYRGMSLVVCSIVQTREISKLWPTKYIKGYKNFEKTVNLWPTTVLIIR